MTRPLDSAIVIQFKRRSGPDKWPAPPAWQSLIDCYITAEQAVDRPETTISTRVSHISRIARALRTDPADVSGDTLKNWFATQKHWARETRRGYRNSASSFFSWAHTEGHLETNPAASLPLIKADRPTPRPAPDRVWAEAILAAEPRTALMLRLAARPASGDPRSPRSTPEISSRVSTGRSFSSTARAAGNASSRSVASSQTSSLQAPRATRPSSPLTGSRAGCSQAMTTGTFRRVGSER